MARLIEALVTPEVKPGDFGPATLTHKAYGFTVQPWNTPKLVSYHVLGVINALNRFIPYPGSEVTAHWTPTDVATVYRDGAFTVDEVLAKHEEIIARQG